MDAFELSMKCANTGNMWMNLCDMVQSIECEESEFQIKDFTEAVKETYEVFMAIDKFSTIPYKTSSEFTVQDILELVRIISGYIVHADNWSNRYSDASGKVAELLLDYIIYPNYHDDVTNGILISRCDFVNSVTGEDIEWTYDIQKGNLDDVVKVLYPDYN